MRAVLVDAHGRVWVGTSDAGIDVLDPASGRIEHLRHDPRATRLAQQRSHLHAGARSRRRRVGRHRGGARSLAAASSAASRTSVRRRARRIRCATSDLAGARRSERRALGRHLRRRPRRGWIAKAACWRRSGTTRGSPPRSRATRCAPFSRITRGTCGSAPPTGSICSTAPPAQFSHYRHDVGRCGLAARLVRHVAVSGCHRPRVDRHAHRRREPLESAQLGARRPSAAVARRPSRSPPSPMRRTTTCGSPRSAAAQPLRSRHGPCRAASTLVLGRATRSANRA